jgi:ATP-dependent RNA helicase DeaD
MLRRAIEAEWMPAPAQPDPRDRERLLEKLLARSMPTTCWKTDAALADTLMERMEVRDIALALVRSIARPCRSPKT